MSGASSSVAAWSTRLEPARRPEDIFPRPDDPRLGEVIELWHGDPAALRPGRAVLIGFPQDEGIRRNHGRAGAADAPHEIRRWLYRLTPWDGAANVDLTGNPPLDVGNVRISGTLEETQASLGEVVGAILQAQSVPIVLGGGHETAFGHYLGYVAAGLPVGVINLDAHLDVRPTRGTRGHSGSPFRQALEHSPAPLPGARYVCLGAEPSAVSREHLRFVGDRGGVVRWCGEVKRHLVEQLRDEFTRLTSGGPVWLSLDMDVIGQAEAPGVSAPNPAGVYAREILAGVRLAGQTLGVTSFEVVEVNPGFDRDGQTARWAALAVWHFLMGLRERSLNQAVRSRA